MRQLVCFALALGLTGPALRAADAVSARARLDAAVAVLQSPTVGEEDSRRIRADLTSLAAESPAC